MNLLIVCPDYASHYLPLSAIATAAIRRGANVTVATGDGLRARVTATGAHWQRLITGRGSNPGVLTERSPRHRADDDLTAFFSATKSGMVAALRFQALERGADLLWRPDEVAAQLTEIIRGINPDVVLADHLSFSSTLALRALGRPFTTFVAGHPTQLPCGDEVYGSPVAWPHGIRADDTELADLRRLCRSVTTEFTDRYNDVLAALDPHAATVADAFAAHGAHVLFNTPEALSDPRRAGDLPELHTFLGSCVRRERADAETSAWMRRHEARGYVYVSLGTFLSARADVLRRIVDALRMSERAVALATGTTAAADLGVVPDGWLVAPTLPQVALLEQASVVITHGGNNTVTEALTAGCPLVVLPLSTDQFAVAADVERCRLGIALDPNTATATDLAGAVEESCSTAIRSRAVELADDLRGAPGPDVAVDRLMMGEMVQR